MHDKHKVLLFQLSDLTPEELQNLHCANEYHWRPEPGKVAGRPLLDCSNAPPDAIPLNSEYTRLRGIERYQQVKLPTFKEIIQEWERYRWENNLQWSDIMWIFKADITGCFNQLYWDQHTTPLKGFMLDEDTLMLMLGHTYDLERSGRCNEPHVPLSRHSLMWMTSWAEEDKTTCAKQLP